MTGPSASAGPAPDLAAGPASELAGGPAPDLAAGPAPDLAAGPASAPATRPGLAPRAWLVWSLAAVTVALVTDNPIYRGLVALVALDVLLAWLAPGRGLRPLAAAVTLSAALAALVNLLAGHTGVDVLARLPGWLPLVGGPLTLESLAFGGALGLGLVAALLAVAPLSLVLEPHDVVDAMPALLERTGIAVATSLNLVSGFGRTFTEVRDAQRMRGWKPGGVRSWNEVLVPAVLTAIEDSVRLAEAMEARAFGAGRRTSYAVSSSGRREAAVVGAAVAAAAMFLGLRVAGAPMDWYPYPTLSMPPVQPLLVLACLALALPAVRPSAARGDGK
ncbi:MAG: CbiQ family ECF transporter T component [Candidatus Limnocylindrales bacterium]|jgi:energy-coupling factor transport system permease protein